MVLHKENENGVTIAFYDSSNILQSVYIEAKQTLYIIFHRGGTYSYTSVPKDVYEEFENCTSQGSFFTQKIKKTYQYKKDFILKEWELNSVKDKLNELKNSKLNNSNESDINQNSL
jgi:hypothetical protein